VKIDRDCGADAITCAAFQALETTQDIKQDLLLTTVRSISS
jgi:hypothetical protein